MKLISMFLNRQYENNLSKKILIGKKGNYKYEEIKNNISFLIHILRKKGIKKGETVITILDNDEYGIFFILAASFIGIQIILPYNLREITLKEAKFIYNNAKYDHIINFTTKEKHLKYLNSPLFSGKVIHLYDVFQNKHLYKYNDIFDNNTFTDSIKNFVVLFTSGSTGAPKGISISEDLICLRIKNVTNQLQFNNSSRIYMSGLLNNTTGFIYSFGAFLHGAILILPREKNIDNWPFEVDLYNATHIMLRPVYLQKFINSSINHNLKLKSLQVIAYGASSVPEEILNRGRKFFNHCDWVQGYGLSESFGPFCWMKEKEHKEEIYNKYIYCLGYVDSTMEVKIEPLKGEKDSNVGDIMIRNFNMMEGYYDITTKKIQKIGEWFITGDLGYFSSEGYLVLKGRKANTVLNSNGHRIYPEEIEKIYRKIEGVMQAVLLAASNSTDLENESEFDQAIICIYGSFNNIFFIKEMYQKLKSISVEKWPDYLYFSSSPFIINDNGKIIKHKIKPNNLFKISNEI